jgi:hypothetical protein
MDKKFEVGQFWKDSDGHKHLICDIDDECIYTFCFADKGKYEWNLDGSFAYGGSEALTEPWKEPRSGEVWVNVFYDNDGNIEMGTMFEDKKECIKHGEYVKLIARIKMPWKEGQFDD